MQWKWNIVAMLTSWIALPVVSDLKLRVTCDNQMTLWVDGNETSVEHQYDRDEMSYLNISIETQVLAIRCINTEGQHGILGDVQNEAGNFIAVTDNSWKCSKTAEDGWEKVDFAEGKLWTAASSNIEHREYKIKDVTSWSLMAPTGNASVIWTGSGDDSVAYCRKVLRRPVRCNGLSSNWTDMETTATFPVNAGDVIKVICLPGYVNRGDSHITCQAEDRFIFEKKPQCRESQDYFEKTEITDENVDEFANSIKQMVEEKDVLTQEKVTTAAFAMDKLSRSIAVKIGNTVLTTVVEAANIINLNGEVESKKESEKEDAKTSTRIVDSIATITAKVDHSGKDFISVKTESISVAAMKGEGLSGEITAGFTDEVDGTNITISTDGAHQEDKTPKSLVKIEVGQVDAGKNVWFTSYRAKSALFKSDTSFEFAGQIVRAGIGEAGKLAFEEEENKRVLMTLHTDTNVRDSNALCQRWNWKDGVGSWSSEGMTFINKTDSSVSCESTGLSNFAILINPSNSYFTGAQELTLQLITTSGCSLSIIGLVLTIVGLTSSRGIRSLLMNRVHVGLSASLIFAYFLLLVGPIFTTNEEICHSFSILTHFGFLCVFCWMLCEAVNLYLELVVVFNRYPKMFLKYSIFTLVTPLFVVMVTMVVDFATHEGAYIVRNRASGVRVMCWLDHKARLAAFMLPLLLILSANVVVFVIVMRVLFTTKKSATATNRLRDAVAVSTLIGLSWVFGFFALGEATFAINVIFTVCNSFQGVLIWYLYCFSKEDVTMKWGFILGKSTEGNRKRLSASARGNQAHQARSNDFTVSKDGTLTRSREDLKTMDTHASLSCNPEDAHIYEYEDITLREPRPVKTEERRKSITLTRNLGEQVRGRVQTYEGITFGAKVVVVPPPEVSDQCSAANLEGSDQENSVFSEDGNRTVE